MILSFEWLREFVGVSASPREFAEAMTMSGSKVEGYSHNADGISGIVACRVTEIEKHPQADKLLVCRADAGGGRTLQIVTGAKNLKVGDLVPCAQDGAALPGGVTIKRGELRGVMSEGMFCSIKELGLTKGDAPYAVEDGIMVLSEGGAPGDDVTKLLGLDNYSFEFEITSNRPDCLSVIGLAREASATFSLPLKLHVPAVNGSGGDINEVLTVEVPDSDLCPRYVGRVIKNVRIGPSPAWMRRRLSASGVRPINNIVDITNYVMLEYGQPMHAFDYSCLKGGKIVVRRAKDGETLHTLDGKERPLKPYMLVIADESSPTGVAGVMGGLESEITDKTTMIVFESANFSGASIRQTAIALGMRTDASGRFEKGLDPNMTVAAVNRACELVELLGAGEVINGVIDINHTKEWSRSVPLRHDRINALLGCDIPRGDMIKNLVTLGFEVEGDEVKVPSWRQDVETVADLAEEAARLYGYGRIPSTLAGGGAASTGLTLDQKREKLLTSAALALGYSEILTYSFISPSFYDKIGMDKDDILRDSVTILNPLGEDTSIMRTVSLPSMLEVLARNYNLRNSSVRLFEPAMVYRPVKGEKLPDERKILTLGAFGGGMDFFALKGDVEALLESLNVGPVDFKTETGHPSYHPGRCARIFSAGTPIGVLGQCHPGVVSGYGIDAEVFVAELDIPAVFSCILPERQYVPLPKYPGAERDIAVVCGEDVEAGSLLKCVRAAAGDILENCFVFDVYSGSQIEAGKKSVALKLCLRSSERTLTDAEADDAVKSALSALSSAFGAHLR